MVAMGKDQDRGPRDRDTLSEATPLLRKEPSNCDSAPKYGYSVVRRVLLTSFLMALSFAVTQVPYGFPFYPFD